MRSRSVTFFCVLFALLTSVSPRVAAEENLLLNGSFETDELGMLTMWSMDAWVDTDAAVRFFATEQFAHSGVRSFAIANLQPNDSRAVQWVTVKPDTLYRFSAWAMAREATSEGIAANLSVLGSTSAAGDLKDTAGEWRYVELYGRTGPQQKYLAVLLRLGFYGSLATGVAIFDDVRLDEIQQLPEGAHAISFGDNGAAEVFPVVTSDQGQPEPPTGASVVSPTLTGGIPWVVVAILACLAAATGLTAALILIALLRVGRIPAAFRGAQAIKITIESLIARDKDASRRPRLSS